MPITESDIQKLANSKSYKRGKEYFTSNAILDLKKRGNSLVAEVEGSDYDPYQVRVELDKDSILSTHCTCPYDGSGVCKHIVAVLLKYLNSNKESIEEFPTVDEIVDKLGESDLRTILIELLKSEPDLIDRVETKIAIIAASANQHESTVKSTSQSSLESQEHSNSNIQQPAKQFKPIDIAPFKREAKKIFKSSNRRGYYDDDYYDEYDSGIADDFIELFQKAKPLIDIGDSRNAISILDAVMDVFVNSWSDEEYYDDISVMIEEAGSLFAEAVLSSELSEKEKEELNGKLTEWQDNLSNQGASDDLDLPIAALEQGWDYPPLKAVLEGKKPESGAWETDEDGEYPEYAYNLNVIRLRVLERQGRDQEYLYFADAEGLVEQYATMLLKLDRTAESIEYVLKNGLYSKDAVKFAAALHDKGLIDDSLKVAAHCMQITEDYIDGQEKDYFSYDGILLLARWLRDNAQKYSIFELALKGAKTAFKYSASLNDYLAIKPIAESNGQWDSLKTELLSQLNTHRLNKSYNFSINIVNIYLYENMLKKAIELIDKNSSVWNYSNMGYVIDAVYKEFPDWAVKKCKEIAEPNMNDGKSKYYTNSVNWVEKAGKISIEAERRREWKEYLEGLIEKHKKKYSLRPQLEALRKL
ncbi:MAG: SWIM zinc finger domain-containing protein [Desulfamplus sp.]